MSIHDQLALVAVVLGFLMLADTARDIIQGPYRRWLRRRYEAERAERDTHAAWLHAFVSATPLMIAPQVAAAAVKNARAFQDGMDRLRTSLAQNNHELEKTRAALLGFNDAWKSFNRPQPGPGRKRPMPGPGHKETV